MSDAPSPAAAGRPPRSIIEIDRAIADLRRGLPVVIRGTGGGSVVALAAESAAAEMFARVCAWSDGPALLALTANRARALNVLPSGHDVVLVRIEDRIDAATARGLADATTDLSAPLRGPFRREKRPPGEAERTAVVLAKRARLLPAAILARLSAADPTAWAAAEGLLAIDSASIDGYERAAALSLRQVTAARVPLAGAEDARVIAFRPSDGGVEHLAIIVGMPETEKPVLLRLHSECFTGDLIGSLKCDCGQQLRGAITLIAKQGSGILLYLAQEGRGIGLINKLRAYRLQQDGFDTVEANLRLGFDADERIFLPAAEMLRQLGYSRVRLLTNNPEKVAGLSACGIEVVERVPHSFPANAHNELYLATKKRLSGHLL